MKIKGVKIVLSLIGITCYVIAISFRSPENALLIIEAESTKSTLGAWTVCKNGDEHYVAGASGEKHLEFQGNNPSTGEPHSPLEYKFKVSTDGNYRLLMNSSKRLEGVRGEGSVKTPEKSWHWSNRAERGKKEFINLVYKLKKGETYTITVAGRSQRFSFDYMVLYDESKFTIDEAKAQSKIETSR